MIRLFEEHQVRKTTELSSSLWDFSQEKIRRLEK